MKRRKRRTARTMNKDEMDMLALFVSAMIKANQLAKQAKSKRKKS